MRAVTETPAEDPRDALIREQAAQIDLLNERIALHDERAALQDERITVLTALAAELRGQLESALRAVSRNSGNSSMPPSGDDLPGRKPPARKERRRAAGGEEAEAREAARVAGRGDALAQGRQARPPLPAGGMRVRR